MSFFENLEKRYRAALFSRQDSDGSIFYFSSSDFPGLIREEFSFKTKRGDLLKGSFYRYDAPLENRLVVFDHGMGKGHRAYMREIEMLARHGYLVFSYDHTGCGESEGEGTRGLSGSLADLDSALCAIKADPRFSNTKISVMGHSWGAFSTLNIAALHPDVTHVIALSGFAAVKRMQAKILPSFLFMLRPYLFKIEERENPDYANYDAEESLKNTTARVLVIHSADDKVSSKKHFLRLRKKLSHRDNIRFILLDGKNHNPNYTYDAIELLGGFFKAHAEKKKAGELDTLEAKKEFVSSFDWWAMTEQDDTVWQEIFNTLSE